MGTVQEISKVDFGPATFEGVLAFCCFASNNDMEASIRKKCLEFSARPHTDAELYDFLSWVSKIQCDRVRLPGMNVDVGYISGFVQSACNVGEFYFRPDDGGEPKITPLEILDQFRR